jgi:hypothetical protein
MDPETQSCLAQFDTHGPVGLMMCGQGGFEEMHADLGGALAAADFGSVRTDFGLNTLGRALDPNALFASDLGVDGFIDLGALGGNAPSESPKTSDVAPIMARPDRPKF